MKKIITLLLLTGILASIAGCASWFRKDINVENDRSSGNTGVQIR